MSDVCAVAFARWAVFRGFLDGGFPINIDGHASAAHIATAHERADTLAGFVIYTLKAAGLRSFSSATSREVPITVHV